MALGEFFKRLLCPWRLRRSQSGPADVESLELTPEMSAEEIAERYRLGRFAELTLEQAGDERGDAIERPDVAEAGVKRTVEVKINAPRVGEFLARTQHPVFKQAARILERSVPEEQGFGRFRDNTKDKA